MRPEAYDSYSKSPDDCHHPACHGVAPYLYCIWCGSEWQKVKPATSPPPMDGKLVAPKRMAWIRARGPMDDPCAILRLGPVAEGVVAELLGHIAYREAELEFTKKMLARCAPAKEKVERYTDLEEELATAKGVIAQLDPLPWERITDQVIAKIRAAGINPQDVVVYTEETPDGRLLLRWRPKGIGP